MNILVIGEADKQLTDWLIPLNSTRACVAVLLVSSVSAVEGVIHSGFDVSIVVLVKPASFDSLKSDIKQMNSFRKGMDNAQILVLADPHNTPLKATLHQFGVKSADHPHELMKLIEAIMRRDESKEIRVVNTRYSCGNIDSKELNFLKKSPLTPRQCEVLTLLKQGKSNKQIATELNLTEGTVKVHCKAIFRALGVDNRTQAAVLLTTSSMGQMQYI
ncbi:MAG: response regulator transcription factor [Granulosicoccus sp.]